MDKIKRISVYVSLLNRSIEGSSWAEVQEKLGKIESPVGLMVIWQSGVSLSVGGNFKSVSSVMGFFRLGLMSQHRDSITSLERRQEIEHILSTCEL